MKRYFSFLPFIVALMLLMIGCKKDEKQVVFEGGTAPVLSSTTFNDTVLLRSNEAKVAFKLSWTNPN